MHPGIDAFSRVQNLLMESFAITVDNMAIVFLVRPVDADEQGWLVRSFVHDWITSVEEGFRKLVDRASSGGVLIVSFDEPHLSDPFLGEASKAFGSLTQAVDRQVAPIRNASLATISYRLSQQLCDSA